VRFEIVQPISEYSLVEKPFPDQLDALDWTVIDQGQGIPTDPTKSLRASFREVTLRDVFNQAVRAINTTDDGRTWLTGKLRVKVDEAEKVAV